MKSRTNLKKWLSVLMSLALVLSVFSGLAFGTKAAADEPQPLADFTYNHTGSYEMTAEQAQSGTPAPAEGDSFSLGMLTFTYDSYEEAFVDSMYRPLSYYDMTIDSIWLPEPPTFEPGNTYTFRYLIRETGVSLPHYSQALSVTISGGSPQPTADFTFTHNGAYTMTPAEAAVSPPAPEAGDVITLFNLDFVYDPTADDFIYNGMSLSGSNYFWSTVWDGSPSFEVGEEYTFHYVLTEMEDGEVLSTKTSNAIPVTITGPAPTITFNHEGGYRYTQDELLAILLSCPDPVLGDSITVNDATYQYTDLLPGAVFVDDKNENPFEDVVTEWVDKIPPVEKGTTYRFKYKVKFMPKFLPEGCEEGVFYESAPVLVYVLSEEEEAADELTRAKTTAIEDLRLYKQAEVDRGDYDQSGEKQINGIKDKGVESIEDADSIGEVNALLALAKCAIDLVEPKAPSPDPTPTPTPDPEKTDESTGIQPGASEASVDKFLTGRATDSDPKGSTVAPLKLVSKKQGKNSIKLNWSRVRSKGAVKYVLYGNRCGKKNKLKKITSLKGKTRTLKKIHGKKLKKGTYYKFIIVAYDSQNKVVATSKVIHVATKGGKVGNHKYVTVKSKKGSKWKAIRKASVKVGKTKKLKAKAKKASHKKVQKHRGVIWESSNARVATVNNKGVVKGVSKGSCTVYAYAQCGVYKAVKITVK